MAAPLGAVLARVADNFNTIKIINLGKPVETILRKNGFLTSYGLAPLEDSNNTTLPFRRIQLTDGRRFEGYLKRHLKFLMDFIKLNNGKLQIVSRFGFYEFANNRESYTKLAADFPGTVVNIEINTGDTASYRLVTDVSPDDIF